MQKEAQEDAERQQKKRREEEAVDWKKRAEDLARERLGRPAPPRQAARFKIARKPPPPEGFQPVAAATVTTQDYLRQKNFTRGLLDVDGDGWYPLHHAIQDTMRQAGLLDVVLELARAMTVEAFDRLANNPRASG